MPRAPPVGPTEPARPGGGLESGAVEAVAQVGSEGVNILIL